ncbi:MAG: glycine cleavage system aminomethyltransferase GcvT [Bdellovibrionales bacterium]|nr:glycine cleavage system aminomethyltransferase GcvT [Bdellovibrionales bacterium]
MLKQTALIEEHRKCGGRLIDFGGWELPVQYSGVLNEHLAVRNACGLFDVSHMGEVWVEGPTAGEFVDFLVTNDISKLAIDQAMYCGLCHESGGLVDDLVVYRVGNEQYLLVVNASNTDKDYTHIQKVKSGFKKPLPNIENRSLRFSQLALQGPKAETILQRLTSTLLSEMKTYWCKFGRIDGIKTLIARTGYTGEDGFELYVEWSQGPALWNKLLEAGKTDGLLPCGLGARDTLRLEMKYALYGHELTDETTPLETGLGWVTKLTKVSDFVGKAVLQKQKASGAIKSLVGVKSLGRAIPRQGYDVYTEDQSTKIGIITSGTSSPSLKLPIGIAFVDKKFDVVGTKLAVKVREELHPFEIVSTPFYKRSKT